MLTARRADREGERSLVYGFQLAPAARSVSLHWVEGAVAELANDGHLPEWTEPKAGCS